MKISKISEEAREIFKKTEEKIPQLVDDIRAIADPKSQADERPETLRISIDSKAKVNIGNFSRNGKTREKEPENALDHDFEPDTHLVPSGIFEPTKVDERSNES